MVVFSILFLPGWKGVTVRNSLFFTVMRNRSPLRLRLPMQITIFLFLCPSIGCDRSSAVTQTPARATSSQQKQPARQSAPLSQIFDLRMPEQGLTPQNSVTSISGPTFEVAVDAGINHVYVNGGQALMLMVQPTGGGCGWIDYDRDGLWDVYVNQGGDPSLPRSSAQPSDQLFRNVGSGQFQSVTLAAQIEERDFSQGVAVGDFDNDGFCDIFVTNAGANSLFQNLGDGTFRELSAQTMHQTQGWHSSAAWGDLDRDGDLDLYVCRYVEFDRFHPQQCRTTKGVAKMCQPNEVEPTPDEFYVNNGDGTFTAAALQLGLSGPGNRALGVAIADFDNDDWPDIYVANDATPNFLFINQPGGPFVNRADLLGCAVASEGRAQASMGVAVGEYDRNGFLDLYLTHFEGEWNTLYQNLGPQGFIDVTASAGGVEMTLPMVGFGVVMEDFNQDGHEDLLIANGHLDDPGHLGTQLAMTPQVFSFQGLKLIDVSHDAGAYFQQKWIGRGLATADYDDDGDLDAVIVHQNSPTMLLRNTSPRGHWLKLNFIGRSSNRRGIGTRVTLRRGTDVMVKELAGGTSYCSSNQPILIFGLGTRDDSCDLEIRWPNGAHQRLSAVQVDQMLTILEPIVEETSVETSTKPE